MSNTLLVYATRWGASAETATIIAAILRDKCSLTVDVINLKKTKEAIDLEKYDNVIIGSSIAYERWTKEAKAFLSNDFSEKKVAVFVCALHYSSRYLENVLEEHSHIQPISIKAFGGTVRFLGITFLNNWNHKHVEEWTEELGKLLVT